MTSDQISYIDTHAHLDDRQFGDEVGDVIRRAGAVGVNRIVNIGYRPAIWQTTLDLAARFPQIGHTLGMHPHHADEWNDQSATELVRLLTTNRPLAIGEIGLDYYRNLSPADVQRDVFRRQLDLAQQHALPVVIHQREAEDDLMQVLSSASADVACVLHSFDGSQKLADFARDRGYYLGVGGLMTRQSSVAIREILKGYPLDRLLLETDAPYLVPKGVKDRRNEPANIPLIAAALAEVRSVAIEQIATQTSANASAFFGSLLSATTGEQVAGLTV